MKVEKIHDGMTEKYAIGISKMSESTEKCTILENKTSGMKHFSFFFLNSSSLEKKLS